MEAGDRTEKYCRCLLFVCDQTSAHKSPERTLFPFRKRRLMFALTAPSQRSRFPVQLSDGNYRCLGLLSRRQASDLKTIGGISFLLLFLQLFHVINSSKFKTKSFDSFCFTTATFHRLVFSFLNENALKKNECFLQL